MIKHAHGWTAESAWTVQDTETLITPQNKNLFRKDTPVRFEIATKDLSGNITFDWVTIDPVSSNHGIVSVRDSTSSLLYMANYETNTKHNKEGIMINSWSGVLIVMLICIFTVKFIIPRLTLKKLVRSVRDRLWKPAKKVTKDIEREWKEE